MTSVNIFPAFAMRFQNALEKFKMKLTSLLLLASVAQGAAIDRVKSSEWSRLKTAVGGRLYPGVPVGASCYTKYKGKSNPHVDLAQCAAYQGLQTSARYLATQFGAYENTNFGACMSKAQGCSLDHSLPIDLLTPLQGNCQQGSVSNYYIDVQSVKDIQNGLSFASKNKIPIVIKNSGHDFKGRSSAPGSLALWMKNFKPGMNFEEKFVPAGCSETIGNVVTFGSGYDFEELNAFAAQHNSAMVSATSSSVGPAGGWLAGGGHSALSVTHGLGVDNVFQMKAVLANGTTITASRCENPDLFWAMRGGGGGTFAVVTEVSQLAHPEDEGYQFAQFAFPNLEPTKAKQFLQICIENAENWANDGWGGYSFPGMVTNHTSTLFLVAPKLSTAQALKSMKPMLDFATDVGKANVGVAAIEPISQYNTAYTVMAGGAETTSGVPTALSSRLVPVKYFRGKNNQKKLLNAMWPIANAFGSDQRQPLFICITAPYKYQSNDLVAPSSVTPAWRNSLWHVIGVNTFENDASVTEIQDAFSQVQKALNPLKAMTPDGGAYQNEADTFEPDAAQSFWGQENYNRLMSIKKQVDPTNLFTCHGCIGWNENDPRFGCYPSGLS